MQLMTFNEILTYLCDEFDKLITPRTIARSNTNIIYLIFKAIAKGMEVINSICVVLNNKFDPARCSVEDLNSVADLVGTERLKGSGSGLHIIVTNEGEVEATLLAGLYYYDLDEDTRFTFEVLEDTVIASGDYITLIAMSDKIGSFPVTAQSKLEVTATVTVPSTITFGCTNNSALLGTAPETDLEFRNRILHRYDGQDSVTELELQLRNLPYLFDCRIVFNNTVIDQTYDGIQIPPFNALICYSGSPRSEMAEIIANKLICPTIQTNDSVAIDYESDVLIGGKHTFYLNPFGQTDFEVKVIYKIDEQYISSYDTQRAIENRLTEYFTPEVHKDFVTEDDVYNVIEALNLSGVTILSVNLKVGDAYVDYVEVPSTRIPHLTNVTFTREV